MKLSQFILQKNSEAWFGGYQFSYELLIFNALFTFIGQIGRASCRERV